MTNAADDGQLTASAAAGRHTVPGRSLCVESRAPKGTIIPWIVRSRAPNAATHVSPSVHDSASPAPSDKLTCERRAGRPRLLRHRRLECGLAACQMCASRGTCHLIERHELVGRARAVCYASAEARSEAEACVPTENLLGAVDHCQAAAGKPAGQPPRPMLRRRCTRTGIQVWDA